MLDEIGSINNVPAFIKRVKGGEGRLMGFGHRVYKSYDPRAKIIKRIADLVFEVTGKNPLLEIALELERIALEDEYFVIAQALPERRLLLRADLPGDGLPGRHVPGAVRHSAHRRLDRAVGRDAASIRSRRSRGRARSTSARPSATTSRARSASSRLAAASVMKYSAASRRRSRCLAHRRCAQAQTPAPPAIRRRARASSTCRQLVAIGPRPAGSPGAEKTRDYITRQLTTLGLTVEEQAFDAADAARRRRRWSNLARDAPGRQLAEPGSPDHRRPLRHEAVQGVRVRRRQRRRVERRVPDRARARAEGADERAADRAAVPRRRGSRRRLARGNDHTYGSRYYVEAAKKAGTLSQIRALDPGRHDRRPRPAHHARAELDAVADRHHLGRRQAPEAPRVPRERNADRGRPPPVPRRPASRRSTSSTSTTPPGTPPTTRSTRSRRGACRRSATCCSPRCPRSRSGC